MLFLTCLAMVIAINAGALGVKRGRPVYVHIECLGPLPAGVPVYRSGPLWPDITSMCAEPPNGYNFRCQCDGPRLICGTTGLNVLRPLLDHCFDNCHCGPQTEEDRSEHVTDVDLFIFNPLFEHPPNHPTQHHTCSGSCTSVNRECAWGYTGDCSCHAPPVGIFFWFKGVCETRFVNPTSGGPGKRGFSPWTRSAMEKSARKNYPAPCNESYVSYACHDATDGIVHEPPEKWLGALLPEHVTEIPPVPAHWLKIHGFEI